MSPDLVAMIPVDEKMAQKKKWAMPFDSLLRRLEEKTRGRVIRADWTAGALAGGPKPGRLSNQEWEAFRGRLTPDEAAPAFARTTPEGPDPLFVEYRVPVGGHEAARQQAR